MGSDSLLTLGIAVMIGSAVEDEGRWRPDKFSVSVDVIDRWCCLEGEGSGRRSLKRYCSDVPRKPPLHAASLVTHCLDHTEGCTDDVRCVSEFVGVQTCVPKQLLINTS